MLKKHLAGFSSNESKGLCPDCKSKHYVNDNIYDFMVTYSTYRGFINIGWNLDENESEEACLVNVEKAFKKAGVVHVPLESINREMLEKYREMISQIRETCPAEYSAELRRLRAVREEKMRAEKRKAEEISQNLAAIKNEAKARETSRNMINNAIEIDKINRKANREETVSKGAIAHGPGIGSNVGSMKDLFKPEDPNRIIARDGTVELKPPGSKYNKTGGDKPRGFKYGGCNHGNGLEYDSDDDDDDDDDPIFSKKSMSDPRYFETICDMLRRDPSFALKFNMKCYSDPSFSEFFRELILKKKESGVLVERGAPPMRREIKKPGHVLDDDSDSIPAPSANSNPFGVSAPIGTPPQSLSSSSALPSMVTPSSTTSSSSASPSSDISSNPPPSPPSSSNSETCGKQFINDSSIRCVNARITYNGKRTPISINETATMEQLYSHVAWLFKGALPAGFKLCFAMKPKGCTYEKGIIPNTSNDTVKIIDRNSINVVI